MEVITILCEWDIGINDNVYATEELAREAAKTALLDCDIEETMDELEDDGLISFESNRVIGS